jgi:hypothetical protein
MVKRLRWALAAAVWLGVAGGGALGAPAAIAPAPMRTASIQEYREALSHARDLAKRCSGDAGACDASGVGDDLKVRDGGFNVHWGWLRESLDKAKKANPQDRQKLLSEVSRRLDEDAGDAGMLPAASSARSVDIGRARAGADAVLARGEFRGVTEESYWRRLTARVAGWLGRLFSGAAGLGRWAAWIGPMLEWGFVVAVCVGAGLWGLRVLKRQRLAIAFGGQPASAREWNVASRRWAESARLAADQADWREAVHSLYWASVVELEGRKILRQSRGRTPREYLRLLDAASPCYAPLRSLTGLLEQIWYGLGAAGPGDYERALAWYEQVRAA